MNERLLHFVWQFQYFDRQDLATTRNEKVNVIHPGFLNKDSGPDFTHGKVYLDGMLWHGHIEIHLKSSDWYLHKHQRDDAYDSVILHVVWENDKEVYRKDGALIPAVELKHKVLPSLIRRYNSLVNSPMKIPCSDSLPGVKEIIRLSMLDKALMERLENKAAFIHELNVRNQGDWEETAYQVLAKNMGFKVNSDSFLQLAQSLPVRILAKHADQPRQVEALLFGQAGFLDGKTGDPYFLSLKKEYEFLRHKYNLEARLSEMHWKFLRMRPGNFPTVRIAQFAALLSAQSNLFGFIRDSVGFQDMQNAFDVCQSDYWRRHYHFGKVSSRKQQGLGKSSIENMAINSAAPLLVAYGKSVDNPQFIEKALQLLSGIPAENNHIVRTWSEVGFKVKTAFDSQALLELYNNFCLKKRCVNCNIGAQLLKD